MLEYLKQLFRYDSWAIEQAFDALDGIENSAALKMLAHILAAKQIWIVRLNGRDSSMIDTQPDLSLDECRLLAGELDETYNEYMNSLDEATLTNTITYTNTKGTEFTTPINEVLTHAAFHSAYHRGQIALLLRQGGNAAVNTDFITFSRL